MRLIGLACLAAMFVVGPAWSQQPAAEEVPAACEEAFESNFDIGKLEACAQEAGKGSMAWGLARMNLATAAFQREDFAGALAIYDELDADGSNRLSDPYYHYARLFTFMEMGRDEQLLKEARQVAILAASGQNVPETGPVNQFAASWQRHPVLITMMAISIEPLQAANDAESLALLSEAAATVEASDAFDAVNLLYVIDELGLARVLEARVNELADRYPSEPGVLNNVCYIMVKAGEAGRFLGRCRRAATLQPDEPAFQHSLYAAYATLNRCGEAREAYDKAVGLLEEEEKDRFEAYACPVEPGDL